MNCRLLRIGGIQDHVHMLIDLHPSMALADLVKNVKAHSSGWMRSDPRFPNFHSWAAEYYACTIAPEQQDAVIEYIKGQREHHLATPFDSEIQSFYRMAALHYHEKDLQ